MNAKFTPGPWYVNRHGYETSYVCHAFVEKTINDPVCGVWSPQGNDEAKANACLIAASPDLYEGLSDLMNWAEQFGFLYAKDDLNHPVNKARAALAKAEGKS